MVVIRLVRHGAHKAPYYRIVVADSRKATTGAIIEQVGTYDPKKDPSEITLDIDKVDEWISKGAQPSETVAKLIAIQKGEDLPDKIQARADAKAAAAEAVKEAPAEEAPAEEPAEAPAAEESEEESAADEAAAEEAPADDAAAAEDAEEA